MFLPFIFDSLLLISLFVVCIITDTTIFKYYNSYDRKDELNRKLLYLVPITILIFVLSIFQVKKKKKIKKIY